MPSVLSQNFLTNGHCTLAPAYHARPTVCVSHYVLQDCGKQQHGIRKICASLFYPTAADPSPSQHVHKTLMLSAFMHACLHSQTYPYMYPFLIGRFQFSSRDAVVCMCKEIQLAAPTERIDICIGFHGMAWVLCCLSAYFYMHQILLCKLVSFCSGKTEFTNLDIAILAFEAIGVAGSLVSTLLILHTCGACLLPSCCPTHSASSVMRH
jgi:hypothetical protein